MIVNQTNAPEIQDLLRSSNLVSDSVGVSALILILSSEKTKYNVLIIWVSDNHLNAINYNLQFAFNNSAYFSNLTHFTDRIFGS